jgi:membrane protease YdiL (CAAX protease family)
MLVSKFYLDTLPSDAAVRSYVKMPAYIILGILSLIFFRIDWKEGLAQWKGHPIKNILFVIGLTIANIVMANVASIPGQLIYGDAETINDSNINGMISMFNPLLILLVVGILGPIMEETVFRVVMIRKLSSKVPMAVCILVSSIGFMLIHVHAFTAQEMIMNLDKLSSGLLFGITLALTKKNATVPAATHIINNTLAMTLTLLAR